MRRLLIPAIFALLSGCSGSYAEGPAASSDGEHQVEVCFHGNRAMSDDDVHAAFAGARDRTRVRRDDFERGVLLLTSAYYDRGHLLVDVKVEGTKDAAVVHIAEGPRFRVASCEVFEVDARGARLDMLPAAAAIAPELTAAAGNWFNRAALVRSIEKLRQAYRDAGFARVEGEPETELDREHALVRIRLPIRRGPHAPAPATEL